MYFLVKTCTQTSSTQYESIIAKKKRTFRVFGHTRRGTKTCEGFVENPDLGTPPQDHTVGLATYSKVVFEGLRPSIRWSIGSTRV